MLPRWVFVCEIEIIFSTACWVGWIVYLKSENTWAHVSFTVIAWLTFTLDLCTNIIIHRAINQNEFIYSLPIAIVLFFQILNTSNVSQAVTLFYVVRNESTVLNGTVSSNLLNQLSAELVGFYLTFPPLTIAEGKSSLYYSLFYCSIFILF